MLPLKRTLNVLRLITFKGRRPRECALNRGAFFFFFYMYLRAKSATLLPINSHWSYYRPDIVNGFVLKSRAVQQSVCVCVCLCNAEEKGHSASHPVSVSTWNCRDTITIDHLQGAHLAGLLCRCKCYSACLPCSVGVAIQPFQNNLCRQHSRGFFLDLGKKKKEYIYRAY